MNDFKKFLEELPEITKKARLADESISLDDLTDKEKQDTFIRLVFLRDATISLIQKLQEDLNKHTGMWRVTQPAPAMIVHYGNLDEFKDILNAVFDQFGNVREEDGEK